MKICVGASAGGHMNQLLRLLNHADTWPDLPTFYVTTLPEIATKLEEKRPVYVIGEYNRYNPYRALRSLVLCFKIAFKERPEVVVTTGAMPLALFSFACKLLGSKVVWIDSIANIESFSLSGRLVHTFADLFLTQWPELADRDKKAMYVGAIL